MIVNYSRFGAICKQESAQAVAPLCGHTETTMWHHCLLQEKVDLRTFRHQEKFFKCVILYERATNVCILYVLIMYLNNALSCSTQ